MTSNEFSFSKFAENAFYSKINDRLVEMADVKSGQRIVDLACGTGLVTELIADRMRGAKNSVIIAIDQSSISLKQAMENLAEVRDAAIQFIQSRVELLSETLKESADTIIFCNAIHYISDKDVLVTDISKALKPGGTFAFNTSFFNGGQHPDSLAFYRKWMLKSLRILRREHGLSPIRADKVESRNHLTPQEYKVLLQNNGFTVAKQEIDTIAVPLEGWLDISDFEDFIQGTMPGVDLVKASSALKKGVAQTYQEMEIKSVPRNWMRVVSTRS